MPESKMAHALAQCFSYRVNSCRIYQDKTLFGRGAWVLEIGASSSVDAGDEFRLICQHDHGSFYDIMNPNEMGSRMVANSIRVNVENPSEARGVIAQWSDSNESAWMLFVGLKIIEFFETLKSMGVNHA